MFGVIGKTDFAYFLGGLHVFKIYITINYLARNLNPAPGQHKYFNCRCARLVVTMCPEMLAAVFHSPTIFMERHL
jgi:hypothetical protein